MAHVIAPDYEQQFLFPPALEDFVPADHPARFLREFGAELALAALGFALPIATAGRPAYAPSLRLKIWLYGYLHRVRSTRKLAAACREHLSLRWLTGRSTPDHNRRWRPWRRRNSGWPRNPPRRTRVIACRPGWRNWRPTGASIIIRWSRRPGA